MWTQLGRCFDKLSEPEKQRVRDSTIGVGQSIQFMGFDGNNEVEHLGAADFLINQLNRFVHYKDHALNSHMPSLGIHRRMLSAYGDVQGEWSTETLTADQIIDVMEARVHPDNR